MPDKRKPSQADQQRGGYNPVPAQPAKPKDQFGPMPTDDPGKAQAADKSREKGGAKGEGGG